MNVSNSVFYRILLNRPVVWIEFLRTTTAGRRRWIESAAVSKIRDYLATISGFDTPHTFPPAR
jgi:hypothetical protein